VREFSARLKEIGRLMRFWNWEFKKIAYRDNRMLDVYYIGRREKRQQALAILGLDRDVKVDPKEGIRSPARLIISEIPAPGALRVPRTLSTVVPLGRSMDEITAAYDPKLRKLVRKNRAIYSIRNVDQSADIDSIDREMLQPYATARHSDGAAQLDLGTVHKLARPEFGSLDVVYVDDEAVACQLGCMFTRSGKRFWSLVRCGFPQKIFSDNKRLKEANAMTSYLSLEKALEKGCDYCDLGISLAQPDGGLLQWKRSRKGQLDLLGNYSYLHIHVADNDKATLFWQSPLFSIKSGNLVLHLGIPCGPSDDEVTSRYSEMGFDGLTSVFLYCERPISENLLNRLKCLYSTARQSPSVEAILTRK
jgi:hypothetical protein